MKSKSVRVSIELAILAQEVGASHGRSMAAQLEYWARVGMAYTAGTGVSAPILETIPRDPEPERARDSPPQKIPELLETFENLNQILSGWEKYIVRPRPDDDLPLLIARYHEGQILLSNMHRHKRQTIDRAAAFAEKYQSTYKDDTDSP